MVPGFIHFVNTSKKYGFVPVYGNGENWMSLIDVEDCAGLIINIIKNCEPGHVTIYIHLNNMLNK